MHRQKKKNNQKNRKESKMKKMNLWIAAIILSCGTVTANAQEYYNTKHEISVTIGSGANTQIIGSLADFMEIAADVLVTSAVTGGAYTGYTTYDNEKEYPAISAEYHYHVSKLISVGGILAFNGVTQDMYINSQINNSDGTSSNKNKVKVGDASRTNITIMPSVKFDWLRKKHFGMYSKAAVGVTIMKEKTTANENGFNYKTDDTDVVANFQASLIGIEAGSEQFRGFAELGVGEQGIILAGVRYKF